MPQRRVGTRGGTSTIFLQFLFAHQLRNSQTDGAPLVMEVLYLLDAGSISWISGVYRKIFLEAIKP